MRTSVRLLGSIVALVLLTSGPAGCLGGFAKLGAKSGGKGARKSAGCGDDVSRGTTRRMVGGGHVATHLTDDGGRFADDVFLVSDDLARLTELDVKPDSRLWLVTDGVARLLQLGDDGVARVAVAMTKDGEPRLWVRLVSDASDLIVELSEQHARIDEILLVDADCADPLDVRSSVGRVEDLPQTRGRVLLLSEAPLDDGLLEVARISGIELIAYGPVDVCGAEGVPYGGAAETVQRALWARTWGEVLAVGATGTLPLVIGDITGAGHWVSMSADGFAASVDARDPSAAGLPPFWVWAVGGGFGGLLGGLFLLWRR